MIRVENLVYEYPGKRALNNISFEVANGSITALVGPNGAGKSTLLRCISGLDEPLSGSIKVAGVAVSSEPRRVHKMLGYLSDAFGIYNELSVRQCLQYAAGLHQMLGAAGDEAATRVMDLLRLTPFQNNKAGTLSRGWRQKLGIAQALIHRPRLLLLDEPASGLDPEARLELSAILKELRASGMTIMVSSHILAELEDYCTDMLVLRDGEIIEYRADRLDAVERILHIRILGDVGLAVAILNEQSQATRVDADTTGVTAYFSGADSEQAALLSILITRGVQVLEFSQSHIRLQDVYLSLSGK